MPRNNLSPVQLLIKKLAALIKVALPHNNMSKVRSLSQQIEKLKPIARPPRKRWWRD
jgi:hypothetical protein